MINQFNDSQFPSQQLRDKKKKIEKKGRKRSSTETASSSRVGEAIESGMGLEGVLRGSYSRMERLPEESLWYMHKQGDFSISPWELASTRKLNKGQRKQVT
jgi:hypothetical protein